MSTDVSPPLIRPLVMPEPMGASSNAHGMPCAFCSLTLVTRHRYGLFPVYGHAESPWFVRAEIRGEVRGSAALLVCELCFKRLTLAFSAPDVEIVQKILQERFIGVDWMDIDRARMEDVLRAARDHVARLATHGWFFGGARAHRIAACEWLAAIERTWSELVRPSR